MKKSQIALQFHWIFIIIAGAIILGFFIGIALRQKAVSEKRLAFDVREKLNEIFAGAGASEGTSIKIDIPNVEIEFSCIGNFSQYSLKGTEASKDTPYEIIFAPDLVKGESIVTWTLPWRVPFKVQNFLIVTSPDVRYIFIYKRGVSEQLANDIMDATPDKITKEMHEIGDIEQIFESNHYRVRFVFLQVTPEMVPTDFVDLDNEAVSAVAVNPTYVQFYRKEGNMFSSKYPEDSFGIKLVEEDPMMYGAIFADGIEMYGCNMAKAYSRLEYVAGIYKERIGLLKQRYEDIEGDTPICSIFYNTDGFDDLIGGAQQHEISIVTGGAGVIKGNNDILEGRGCPTIY